VHLKTITEYSHQVSYGPAKLGETRYIYLNASKAQKLLGWKPRVDLEAGLRRTVEFFQSQELAK